VLSVPTTYKELEAQDVVEALADGVPVMQPRHWTWRELLLARGHA
jgi:hypothetical protein